MNYNKITAEALGKIVEMQTLTQKKTELLGELRLSMMHQAIKHNVCKVVVNLSKRQKHALGAKLMFTRTNNVGETLQDDVLLTYDEYHRLIKEAGRARYTSYIEAHIKRNWNKEPF